MDSHCGSLVVGMFGCSNCEWRCATLQELGLHARIHHGVSKPRNIPFSIRVSPSLPLLRPRPGIARAAHVRDLVRRTSKATHRTAIEFIHPRPTTGAGHGGRRRAYTPLQRQRSIYLDHVESLFSPDWWVMFDSVRMESGATLVR